MAGAIVMIGQTMGYVQAVGMLVVIITFSFAAMFILGSLGYAISRLWQWATQKDEEHVC